MPQKASKYEGENYKEVIKELEELGFCNIELSVEHDINWVNILPFTASDGDVKSISINEQSDFKEGDTFLWTSKVKIVYHSK